MKKLLYESISPVAGYSWPRMELNHVIPFAALSPAMLAHRSGRHFKQTNTYHNDGKGGLEPPTSFNNGSHLLSYFPCPSFLTMR